MIEPRDWGGLLLEDWQRCKHAKPRGDAVNLQVERDRLDMWAQQLGHLLIWETNDNLIAETCYQFESRLTHYREKVILEILTHGTI